MTDRRADRRPAYINNVRSMTDGTHVKTNDPKGFKLGIGNDLGISKKWCGLGVKRKVKVTGSISAWLLFRIGTPRKFAINEL